MTWPTLEDHIVGFRGSAGYRRWKTLLLYSHDPFPAVEHYRSVGLDHPS